MDEVKEGKEEEEGRRKEREWRKEKRGEGDCKTFPLGSVKDRLLTTPKL